MELKQNILHFEDLWANQRDLTHKNKIKTIYLVSNYIKSFDKQKNIWINSCFYWYAKYLIEKRKWFSNCFKK